MDSLLVSLESEAHAIIVPVYGDWQCHLFGSNGDGISWRPLKGREPNAFWRLMQFVVFGNRWVRRPERRMAA